MNNLYANPKFVLEVLRKISKEELLADQSRQTNMSNLALVSLSLTSEYMGIDYVKDLIKRLPRIIFSKIERSVYNRRRHTLVGHNDSIRLKLVSYINKFEDYFIVNKIPLEVCNLSRSSRSRICMKDSLPINFTGICSYQGHGTSEWGMTPPNGNQFFLFI